jgi:hypothetical protein
MDACRINGYCRALLVALAVAVLGLAGCGEREQVVQPQSEKRYQGKPDTPPWGDGDRAGWEARIKARQLTQNEYKRIYE